MIDREHQRLSVSRQCRLLAVSRSTVYYRPRGESAQTLALMRRIDELYLDYPFYGSRQMMRHLAREGVAVGRHRVRRLMRLLGLEAIYRKPRTTVANPEHRVYPYLLRGVTIERSNQVWCADIERHEALSNLAVVGGHRHRLVAAGRFEAEGSPNRGTPGKAEAALTTTGRASTVRWCGSGKRDGKVYVRNQRQKTPQAKTTSSNLTDRGWVATHIRPARPVGELLGRSMSPAGRPR